jgi:hypothetical protein
LLLGAFLLLSWRFSSFSFWFFALVFSAGMSFVISLLLIREEKQAFELLERQKECLVTKIDALTALRKSFAEQYSTLIAELAREKELTQSLQRSVEEAVDRLRALQKQDHFEKEVLIEAHLLRHQHKQLRQQFEEKQQQLQQIRASIFAIEGQVLIEKRKNHELTLQQNEQSQISEELARASAEESTELQIQVEELESLVSHLSAPPKKRATRKKQGAAQELTLGF